LLDPAAYWAKEVMDQLMGKPDGEERFDVEALLRVPDETVTAVVIVKDEASTIGRCLASLQGAVDRILMFDNGSTDDTVEFASSYPNVEIRRIEWKESFGAMRNEALSAVATDWVLWIDGDEWLHEQDRTAVKEAAGCYAHLRRPVVLNIWHLNYVNGHPRDDISQSRMFRLGDGLTYYGSIHEQVGTERGGIYDETILRKNVRIRYHHTGYEPAVMKGKEKLHRNRRLLLRMTEEEPSNPAWWYFLGRETLGLAGGEEAVVYLERALEEAESEPRFGRQLDVLFLLLRIAMEAGDEAEITRLFDRMLAIEPDHPNVRMLVAEHSMNEGRKLLGAAADALKKAVRCAVTYRGVVSADRSIAEWRAVAAIGGIKLKSGLLAEANRCISEYEERSEIVKNQAALIRDQSFRLSFKSIPKVEERKRHD
jgi:glycosyltransferase involved in cell wall biosynthesis